MQDSNYIITLGSRRNAKSLGSLLPGCPTIALINSFKSNFVNQIHPGDNSDQHLGNKAGQNRKKEVYTDSEVFTGI